MGTNTLNVREMVESADDCIVIMVNAGQIEVHSSIDTKGEFFEILEVVAEMADDYYPEESVDNLH